MSEQVNDDVVDRGGSKKAGRLYQFFASTKLAWYLTLALGLIILIGTIIPQKGITLQPDAAARHIAEDTWWRLADSLGFLEIFHQWYFFVLLGLFYTNLIVGSVDGLSRLERQLEVSGRPLTDELKKRLRNRSVDLPKPVTAEMVAREFEGAIKFQAPTSEGQTSFMFGEKGRLSRFMPYILHFGFIIIGIGGAITAMKGMEGRMFIPEGTSSNKFFVQTRDGEVLNYELPFDVRCDDFRIEFYPGTQQPKDFNSDLAVIDNGQELFRRTIEVNDPLRYKGFRLFQAFYERIGTMARMKVTDTDGQVVLDRLMTKSEVAPLTTTDGFTIVDFVPNHDDKGPALQVRALTNGETQEFWV
ncbi:cytochrome c biogenesis protein ResB, partial [bacterium]|nr:cytochrome c biogenesis protein ResB [bacterium]